MVDGLVETLETQAMITQATGVIMAQEQLTPDEAVDRLRTLALASGESMPTVADWVLEERPAAALPADPARSPSGTNFEPRVSPPGRGGAQRRRLTRQPAPPRAASASPGARVTAPPVFGMAASGWSRPVEAPSPDPDPDPAVPVPDPPVAVPVDPADPDPVPDPPVAVPVPVPDADSVASVPAAVSPTPVGDTRSAVVGVVDGAGMVVTTGADVVAGVLVDVACWAASEALWPDSSSSTVIAATIPPSSRRSTTSRRGVAMARRKAL